VSVLPTPIEPSHVTPWLTKLEAAERARLPVGTLERAMRRWRLGDKRLGLRHSGGGKRGGGRVVVHETWLDAWLERRSRGESS
jgi:hypothetical protein